MIEIDCDLIPEMTETGSTSSPGPSIPRAGCGLIPGLTLSSGISCGLIPGMIATGYDLTPGMI